MTESKVPYTVTLTPEALDTVTWALSNQREEWVHNYAFTDPLRIAGVARVDAALEEVQSAAKPDDVTANAYDLLEVVKLTYRKHHADDAAIGWDELSGKLADVLSNAMGVENFVKWQENNYVD